MAIFWTGSTIARVSNVLGQYTKRSISFMWGKCLAYTVGKQLYMNGVINFLSKIEWGEAEHIGGNPEQITMLLSDLMLPPAQMEEVFFFF